MVIDVRVACGQKKAVPKPHGQTSRFPQLVHIRTMGAAGRFDMNTEMYILKRWGFMWFVSSGTKTILFVNEIEWFSMMFYPGV